MKTIKVACPKCHKDNTVAPPSEGGGHVLCSKCNHIFKVVPRRKQATVQSDAGIKPVLDSQPHLGPRPSESAAAYAATKDAQLKAAQANLAAMLQSFATPSASAATRAPSNPFELINPEQDGGQHHSLSFKTDQSINILLSYNAETQKLEVTQSSQPTAKAAAAARQTHTDNLVFTLLPPPDGMAGIPNVAALPSPNMMDSPAGSAVLYDGQKQLNEKYNKLQHEIYWALASLAALTVLILQLFYLMMV